MKVPDELKNFTHIDLLFPSKYAKAADLRGKSVPVVIASISPREKLMMQGGKTDTKPVMFFVGKEKGLILNKTNARDIAKAYGPEITAWLGKTVYLISKVVEARGEQVDAIRIDLAATMSAARGEQREPGGDDMETA